MQLSDIWFNRMDFNCLVKIIFNFVQFYCFSFCPLRKIVSCSQPFLERSLGDLTKCISDNNFTVFIDDTWGWISSAWNLSLVCRFISSEWKSNPRCTIHCDFEAIWVLISRNNDNLKLFALFVPVLVVIFQVVLERCASTSPGCGVHDHYKRVSSDCGVEILFLTVFVHKLLSQEAQVRISHILNVFYFLL